MTLEEMLAREEIRVLLASYSMAGDRARLNELANLFTPNGVLNGWKRLEGREVIIEGLAGRRTDATEGPDRAPSLVRHNLTSSLVTFDSETVARGRTYFFVVTNIGPDHMGVYVDRFQKHEGNWLIAERRVQIDWVADNGHTRATQRPG